MDNAGHPRQRQRKGRKGGKGRQNHFMDAAMEGYVRDLSLRKWREIEDAMETHGLGLPEAAREMGDFLERGRFYPVWRKEWEGRVLAVLFSGKAPANPMGLIEESVGAALREERRLRVEEGLPTLEDSPGYLEFVGRAMDQLLEEASGEIEEMD